jgi:large subunit ribosomal protein L19
MTENNTDKKLIYRPGMLVKVHQKIKETNTKGEEKDRIQVFEGTIIAAKHGQEAGATITVRKISNAVGVEKIFPIHSPVVEKIEVVKEYAVRRAKLHYLRDPKFKRKIEEKKTK